MFVKIVIFIVLYFVQDMFAYKLIRKIDKKERIKLDEMEEKHVQYMLDNKNVD